MRGPCWGNWSQSNPEVPSTWSPPAAHTQATQSGRISCAVLCRLQTALAWPVTGCVDGLRFSESHLRRGSGPSMCVLTCGQVLALPTTVLAHSPPSSQEQQLAFQGYAGSLGLDLSI